MLRLILSLVSLFLVGAGAVKHLKEDPKTYSVKKITSSIALSGTGDHPDWKTAHVLTDFNYPWDDGQPRPIKFRALHNDGWLYCLFDVEDLNINIREKSNHKSEVASSTRAEIFFRADERLTPYYCLEIDPLGRVLDYEATYHRNFDTKWSWPPGHLVIKTAKRKKGYTVEVAISKTSLKELGLLKDNVIQAGLFTAECFQKEDGEPEFKWISWVKPASKTPDFHIPSSFGVLQLEDK
ncbi:MAG TPA: carbohydrate-binding family 9-like protein [Chryseosolibacter sp.]|nr:carbohydrate-binding family 9-like protein [Chryseosolibacter sp.]